MKLREKIPIILLLLIPWFGQSQVKFDNFLYGIAYCHEYMLGERLNENIRLIKDVGISVVQLEESTWSEDEKINLIVHEEY